MKRRKINKIKINANKQQTLNIQKIIQNTENKNNEAYTNILKQGAPLLTKKVNWKKSQLVKKVTWKFFFYQLRLFPTHCFRQKGRSP